MTEGFQRVARVAEIAPGTARCVFVNGEPIALANVEGTFYAIGDTCSHAEASLSDGEIYEDTIMCPLHGAEFSLKTGKALTLPAISPVPSYEVRVEGDDILIKA